MRRELSNEQGMSWAGEVERVQFKERGLGRTGALMRRLSPEMRKQAA